MIPNIYFWNQIMDIAGRTSIILIIAFVISHLIIKNNFNIIKPNWIEKILLTLTFILIYTVTLLFNYGEQRLLIFDLALPIVIVSGILSGLRVSAVVSTVAALMINYLFPLSWPYAVLTLIAGLLSGALSHIKQTNRQKMYLAAAIQFVFSLAQVGIIYFLFEGFLYQLLWQNVLSIILIVLVQMTSVVMFLYTIYSIIHFQKAQALLYYQNQQQLRSLESQVNPHFLFNSLNTIGSLTRTNPDKAHELIIELSSLLRNSLRKQGETIPLVDEIRNIDSYLSIAQARFGNRIEIKRDIPEIYLRYHVPNLIWEPIVENAIIHNIKKQELVKVSISAKKIGDFLHLITIDNGQGIAPDIIKKIKSPNEETKHLGLSSTRLRLLNFYHQDDLVDINTASIGTIVTIKIPV